VDGIVPNSFHLSHWQGNRTPPELRADTSTEIALKFITSPQQKEYGQGLQIITNNHYDTDGLLSLWSLLSPPLALSHKDLLIAAAEAGDFYRFTTDPAVQLDLLIKAFRHSPDSPLASSMKGLGAEEQDGLCYTKMLELLPTLLSNPRTHQQLWQEEYKRILTSFEAFEKGDIILKEFPQERLSVIVSKERPSEYAIDRHCQGDLYLIVQVQSEGFCYDLEYRYYSWAETVTRPKLHHIPMERLASRLNVYDGRALGRWMSQDYPGQSLTSVLKYTNPQGESLPSRFPFENVAGYIRDYIREEQMPHSMAK
jgi:hypothetical protein